MTFATGPSWAASISYPSFSRAALEASANTFPALHAKSASSAGIASLQFASMAPPDVRACGRLALSSHLLRTCYAMLAAMLAAIVAGFLLARQHLVRGGGAMLATVLAAIVAGFLLACQHLLRSGGAGLSVCTFAAAVVRLILFGHQVDADVREIDGAGFHGRVRCAKGGCGQDGEAADRGECKVAHGGFSNG